MKLVKIKARRKSVETWTLLLYVSFFWLSSSPHDLCVSFVNKIFFIPPTHKVQTKEPKLSEIPDSHWNILLNQQCIKNKVQRRTGFGKQTRINKLYCAKTRKVKTNKITKSGCFTSLANWTAWKQPKIKLWLVVKEMTGRSKEKIV